MPTPRSGPNCCTKRMDSSPAPTPSNRNVPTSTRRISRTMPPLESRPKPAPMTMRSRSVIVRRSSSDAAVMTDIKPRPPIWMSRRITHLPKSDQCTAVLTVTRPVTQVALVAVNSASMKGVARPLFAAHGSMSSSAPARIMSAKPTAITIAACIARLFGARLLTPVTAASPLAFPIYNSLIQRLYHI